MRLVILSSAMLLLMTVIPVSADDVGFSTGCWDEEAGGGSAYLGVKDGQVQQGGMNTNPNGVFGAARALANGEADPSSDHPACTDQSTTNYTEVHAEVGSVEAQVCYDGELKTDGSCPTTPVLPPPPHADHVIEIGTVTSCSVANYDPDPITIAVGESVRWDNVDSCAHTATSDAGSPDSFNTGTVSGGSSSSPIVFDTAGTYAYHCNFHAGMAGEIHVV